MALVTIVCGGQGVGKTTFVKNSLYDKRRTVILDVNNEYTDLESHGSKRVTKDFRDALENIKNLNGISLVVEEATVFFSNRKYDDNLQEMIIRKRHQKNDIFLIYHSLGDIPDYLLRIADFLVLFKTKDNQTHVEDKYRYYPELKSAYYTVRNQKNIHKYFVLKLLK
jgi:DNA helicase HerA-like ATPase